MTAHTLFCSLVLLTVACNQGSAQRGSSPLLCNLALRGDFEGVQASLRDGADVNARNEGGQTALMCAVSPHTREPSEPPFSASDKTLRWKHKLQIARRLIESGADVRLADEIGLTALHDAVSADGDDRDVVALIDLLVKHGADVNRASTEYRRMPLEYAIETNSAARVRQLVHHGANPNVQRYEGGTLLAYARALGNDRVIAAIEKPP